MKILAFLTGTVIYLILSYKLDTILVNVFVQHEPVRGISATGVILISYIPFAISQIVSVIIASICVSAMRGCRHWHIAIYFTLLCVTPTAFYSISRYSWKTIITYILIVDVCVFLFGYLGAMLGKKLNILVKKSDA